MFGCQSDCHKTTCFVQINLINVTGEEKEERRCRSSHGAPMPLLQSPEPQLKFKYNLKHGRVGWGGKCACRRCCLLCRLCLKSICFSRLTQVWSKSTAVRPWTLWRAAGDGLPGVPSSRSWAEKPEPNLAVCVFCGKPSGSASSLG